MQDIANEAVFALKGGTAINLFYRNMPRLSVDIDLTYLPVADRQSSLREMDEALGRLAAAITRRDPRVEAHRATGGGKADTRIMVGAGQTRIKIETSPGARGAVYPERTMIASEPVTERFGFAETTVLAFGDVYGGKLAAALVHDPEVLILDEPLNGLDPVQRRRMIDLFHGLGDEGRCVLVSSHILEEVARLGSRILVIAQGRLVATGDYRELRDLMDDRPHVWRSVSMNLAVAVQH